MPVNVNDKIRKLSSARRKKVEARATELIAEEMTLRQMRKARRLTQVRMAKAVGITQDGGGRRRLPLIPWRPRMTASVWTARASSPVFPEDGQLAGSDVWVLRGAIWR